MKKAYYLIIILSLLGGCNKEKSNSKEEQKPIKLNTYSERINEAFTLSFEYENKFIVSRIDNGICISDVLLEPENYNDKKVFMGIWMQSKEDNDMESLIQERRNNKSRELMETRERFQWNNTEVTMVLLKQKDVIEQKLIYFIKYKTLFEVVISKDFDSMDSIFKSMTFKD